ncbi:MAG: SDR family oxidoreductase [Candidatus Tritonobacter lacicola]|nr:SDR family oxidoreductase [Candidatus Tritonobacter lacicola]
MSSYCVTGGAGFIGSHIVRSLIDMGEQVVVLDNLSSGRPENLEEVRGKIKMIVGDIRDVETVNEALKGVEYVLHQAALSSVPRSVADPMATDENNTRGTLNILLRAREAGVKRLVFASSSSIYGDSPIQPKAESQTPNPMSPYAVSKLVGELYCRVFHELFGLETISLRYFNVFGPRQDPASEYAAVVPKFVNALLAGRRPSIYGDGEQSRDFTYVSNVVAANMAASRAPAAASGRAYNIACGKRTSVLELFRMIAGITGSEVEPVYKPKRSGDILHSFADISLAKDELGYEPSMGIEEGMKKTVEFFISKKG